MITITISNAQQIVLEKKGWFVAKVVSAFVDIEAEVETVVMERIRASLSSEGVVAVVAQAPASATKA